MAASPSRRTSGRPQTSPHYDPSTSGTWDGQLPHPDVAGQLSPAGLLEKPPRDWPSIIERDGFADLTTVTFNLTGPESAVLRRILFRAGSASQGCWESLPNMGRYLGFNERTVRRALARLLGLGLIHKVKAPTTAMASRTATSRYCELPILDSLSRMEEMRRPFWTLCPSILDSLSTKLKEQRLLYIQSLKTLNFRDPMILVTQKWLQHQFILDRESRMKHHRWPFRTQSPK